jgi:hypothetical protein
MSTVRFLLADAKTAQLLASLRIDPAIRDKLIIFGAIALVTLLLLLWAVFLRKRGRRHHSHHHSHEHPSRPAEVPAVNNEEGAARPGKRRWRRRRHSRNPTLAETRGLPPVRQESPPEAQT